MASLKPLIMRANRLLGASLVERGLVSIEALDAANERLLELLIEDEGLGLMDVRNIEVPEELVALTNCDECWATWTVPFDMVEDTRYVATAYYLSPAVRSYWEDKTTGKIIWFAAPLHTITEYLEALEAKAARAASPAAH